jgi:hypothetical protein
MTHALLVNEIAPVRGEAGRDRTKSPPAPPTRTASDFLPGLPSSRTRKDCINEPAAIRKRQGCSDWKMVGRDYDEAIAKVTGPRERVEHVAQRSEFQARHLPVHHLLAALRD